MKLQLIRNATLRLTYAGHTILIDPYFASKHTLPSYANKSKNPLVDLPIAPQAIMQGIDLIIVSHLHTDHFDGVAKELLPKDLPLFCQPTNEGNIEESGFSDVRVIDEVVEWNGIKITRTDGQHGEGETAELMGKVSGFVFKAEGEPTLYWAGDTIWYEIIEQAINDHQPDVIVTHSCGAIWGKDYRPIVMDAVQTVDLCKAAPNSMVIATHMEALDHGMVTRAHLRAYADAHGISNEQLLIPDDGEVVTLG